jgi:hypothetical protein
MPLNLIKKYSDLLELMHLSERERIDSLKRVFERDIEHNTNFTFNGKHIRPIKGEEPAMQLLFKHLTTHEIQVIENGQEFSKRIFEMARSVRLHWIKFHIEKQNSEVLEIFSVEERYQNRWVIKTYILDKAERYVIILEPYRRTSDYYLITAYFLEDRNFKKMMQKMKRKLPELH